MKTHKRQMPNFEFFDYEGMERHLNKMAQKGWRLERMTRMFWHYRRTECKTLRYTVIYFPEASDFNPHPTEGQETFRDYCAQAGWTLAASLEQIQVFCSELENPDPIETDESVKLSAIHQAMKKLFLPYSIVQLLLCILLSLQRVYAQRNALVEVLSSGAELAAVLIWPLVALFAGSRLLHYALWYCRSKRSTALGGRCASFRPIWRALSWVWAALLLLLALWMLADVMRLLPWGMGTWVVLALLALYCLIIPGFFGLRRLGRWMGWSGRANQAFSWIVCVLAAFLLSSVMVFVLNTAQDLGAFDDPDAETFTWTDNEGTRGTWHIRHDPIPLTVEDLTGLSYEHYTYELRIQSSSPLASRLTAVQRAYPPGTEIPDLSYTLVTVRVPVLYDPCVGQYLNRYANWKSDCVFQPEAPEPWGADRAYRLWRNGEAEDEYLVCWGNQILLLQLDFTPTEAQMAVVTERLTGV